LRFSPLVRRPGAPRLAARQAGLSAVLAEKNSITPLTG
jgi:hypothetical protein